MLNKLKKILNVVNKKVGIIKKQTKFDLVSENLKKHLNNVNKKFSINY